MFALRCASQIIAVAVTMAIAAPALHPSVAEAEVTAAAPGGFTVRSSVEIDAPADTVWRMLVGHIGEWWNGAHSYSGNALNLYLETRPNGCFCERLSEEGAVVHMTVTFIDPARMLRLTGGLGPLGLMGVSGNMTWSLVETDGRTSVALDYAVGGYDPDGLDRIAPAVDRVLAEQLLRLKSFIETGDPTDAA